MAAYEFDRIQGLCRDWSCMNEEQKRPYRDLAETRSYSNVREQMLDSMRTRHFNDMIIEKRKKDEIKACNDAKAKMEYSRLQETIKMKANKRRMKELQFKLEHSSKADRELLRIKSIEKSLEIKANNIALQRKKMKKKMQKLKLKNKKVTSHNKNMKKIKKSQSKNRTSSGRFLNNHILERRANTLSYCDDEELMSSRTSKYDH